VYTLGINAAFHDSAACLVRDGRVIAAAEEERFTGIKHAKRPTPFSAYELPFHAIDYCLREAGIGLADVEHVAYAFDPSLLLGRRNGGETITLPLEPSAHPVPEEWQAAWDPLFLSSIVNAPRHLRGGVPHHLTERLRKTRADGGGRWHFVEHHVAHAVSAFHASPFSRAAVMTLDGRGERATTTYSLGDGARLERLGQVEMPHSLGLLYERVTEYLGFQHASDEYKVMALASFGRPRYRAQFSEIIELTGEGGYVIRPPRLSERFGPPRRRGEPLLPRHQDIARSLQDVLEDAVLELARWLHRITGAERLCLAGGVALNCVLNGRLLRDGPFREIWVQPAAGDAGTALGAALWVDARERRASNRAFRMDDAYLGPAFADDEIEDMLRWTGLRYRRPPDLVEATADLLAQDKVVGWFQGRMEFGPRALGSRSILASPLHAEMQERLNAIKGREEFRPVAPVVLEEEAGRCFAGAGVSPFMLFVYPVHPEVADRIPAVRHVDGTARVQTINRCQHPTYYDLVRAFFARTGVPVLVNTSFNTQGRPIVCTPRDALACFCTAPLDALALGSFLLEKSSLP
jgi:carbamoyltransferase